METISSVMEYLSPTMMWASLFFATLVILSIIDMVQRHFTYKRQELRCVNETQTIFVAIQNFSGAIAGGRCLFSLFEHAKCPSRVRVGIYESSYMPRAVAVPYYESLQRRFSLSNKIYSSSIKSIANSTRNGGPYAGRQSLIENAYSGEDFILTIHDGVEMLQNWDSDLIEAHKKSSTELHNTVLVAPPSPIQTLSTIKNISFNIFGISSQAEMDPRYPIVGGFSESGLPLHASKPFLGRAKQPEGMKSLLWVSSCAFAPSAFFVDSKISALEQAASGLTDFRLCHAIPKRELPHLFQEDTLITCDGMAAGWTFTCSPKCVSKLFYDPDYSVLSTRSGIALENIHTTSKAVRDLLHNDLAPYLQELGLYKKASPKAFSGVVDLNNTLELENKHGSAARVINRVIA